MTRLINYLASDHERMFWAVCALLLASPWLEVLL